MSDLIEKLSPVTGIAFFVLGCFQWAAIQSGMEVWLGDLPWLIVTPLSLILAMTPLVGTVVGMFGAVEAWHWSWTQAFLLFCGPLIIALGYMFFHGTD